MTEQRRFQHLPSSNTQSGEGDGIEEAQLTGERRQDNDYNVFEEDEHARYAEAFAEETERAQQFTASLGMGHTPTQPWQTGVGV